MFYFKYILFRVALVICIGNALASAMCHPYWIIRCVPNACRAPAFPDQFLNWFLNASHTSTIDNLPTHPPRPSPSSSSPAWPASWRPRTSPARCASPSWRTWTTSSPPTPPSRSLSTSSARYWPLWLNSRQTVSIFKTSIARSLINPLVRRGRKNKNPPI